MQILSSFIPNYNYTSTPSAKRESFFQNKYPNLAPLKYDTVSFCGVKKELEEDDYKNGVNFQTAKRLHEDALPCEKYLDKQLSNILGDLIRPETGKTKKQQSIYKINIRTKSPNSILEKSKTDKLNSFEEVKEGMTDIVGARIVLADSNIKAVDTIIDRFTQAVKDDKLTITRIENYRPEPELDEQDNPIEKYDYASAKALKKLHSECLKKYPDVRRIDDSRPSGYMAIHMNVMLPNGYTGEIQIMGGDVEDLKNIEDLCYKIKNNKSIAKKYGPIRKILEPLKNKNDVILQNAFTEYTKRAYIDQRRKEPLKPGKKPGAPEFLSIPEDLDYIPAKMDFNNLYKLKQKCDRKQS